MMHKPIVKKSRLTDDWWWMCTGCAAWRHRPSWRTAFKSAFIHAIYHHPFST